MREEVRDGRGGFAEATAVLGSEEGTNVIEARFPDTPDAVVTFALEARKPAEIVIAQTVAAPEFANIRFFCTLASPVHLSFPRACSRRNAARPCEV